MNKKSAVSFIALRSGLLVATATVFIGCASQEKTIVVPGDVPPASALSSSNTNRTNSQGDIAGEAESFSTQSTTYQAVSFEKLPGWASDNHTESWPALLTSCSKLALKTPQWNGLCQRAKAVDQNNNAAIRSFFEKEFAAYQMRDDARKPDGVITGYFEPEIVGSRQYKAPYVYPVYAAPDDMFFLDARKVDRKSGLDAVVARIDGRNVSIQKGVSTKDMSASGLYLLDLPQLTLDTLDKKVRLRIEGKRLMPYYTRSEIEKLGVPNAKVLAFVQNLSELYEMQIQGTGRIKLTDGNTLHLSYAEQNGHPFRPTVVATSSKKTAVKTRGGFVELDSEDDDEDDSTVRTRGFKLAKPAAGVSVAVSGQKTARPATGSGITDPSYVFFKENPPTGSGPIGALNVPLLAGRSIAVDPRSTPLGYPVFMSTRDPGTGKPMQRLTIAQDTGGAIRGAVRADYFLGNGPDAAKQARRMKASGQLWLLLPRGLQVSASGNFAKTRGTQSQDLAQCLVQTEDVCVDDE